MQNAKNPNSAHIIEKLHSARQSAERARDESRNTPALVSQDVPIERPTPIASTDTWMQRLRDSRGLRKAIDKYRHLVTEEQARVLIAFALDQVDAASDKLAYQIFLRKGEHSQRIAAAAQLHDEKLAHAEEFAHDRWSDLEANRIIELASQHEQGVLTNDAFSRRVEKTMSFYDGMRDRASGRIEGLRQTTDDLVGFGRPNSYTK